MKILFVCSGNKKMGISSFVESQAKSIIEEGYDVVFFIVKKKGIIGYLSSICKLRKAIRREKPDIVHAHYSLCGLLASLSTRKPVLVSVLGSFPNSGSFKLKWVRYFSKHIWNATIVKSQLTAIQIGNQDVHIVPNGVNLQQFVPLNYYEARSQIGFESNRKYVIFVSNPIRKEKNFALASAAIEKLQDRNTVLIPIFDKPHNEIIKYMSAADALILTSSHEGSPNVIKEAMACNCPIVSTECGDVKWVTEGVSGCIVTNENDAIELSKAVKNILNSQSRTLGRDQIIKLGLDSHQIAQRIIKIYNSIV